MKSHNEDWNSHRKIQQDATVYQNLLFRIYMKLSVYSEYTLPDSIQQPHVQQPPTYAKPEAASAVLGSWWWVMCLPKHAELYVNTE